MSKKTIEIKWQETGNGWIGHWRTSDGEIGPGMCSANPQAEFVIEPEGGLYGEWSWHFRYGLTTLAGNAPSPDDATEDCEMVFQAYWQRDQDETDEEEGE